MPNTKHGHPVTGSDRTTGVFRDPRQRRHYFIILTAVIAADLLIAALIMGWDNPMPFNSEGFWLIAQLRGEALTVILVAGICHGFATVAFQTVSSNRILTPSIMGFEALYRAIATSAVFFFGIGGINLLSSTGMFLFQVAAMIGFSALLYGTLFSGRFGNMHVMLLVGVVIGGGLGSLSVFMQRLLSPSEFDVLSAKLLGSIGNAEVGNLAITVPVTLVAAGALLAIGRRLNVLALGRDVANTLGLNHRRQVMLVLLLVSVLMAMSTSTVGPMTFLGFLAAAATYQLADTYDHRLLLPLAGLVAFFVLAGAYFIMKHVFYAQGSVTVIVEIIGGTAFLAHLLRKAQL